DPQVPIHAGGKRRGITWPRDALRPIFVEQAVAGPIGPDVGFVNRADDAGPDQLAHLARLARGLAGVAHLGGKFGFARRLGHLPRLPDVVRERLFAIYMLAA